MSFISCECVPFNMVRSDYLNQIESYRRRYYPEGRKNLFIPNGIKDLRTLLKKSAYLLKIIKTDGKIIDFGCGNGMMLKFIVLHTKYKLIPYGVDFLPESIKQAKTKIFPEFKKNFECMNIHDYDFAQGAFHYILTNPAYLYEDDWNRFYKKCMRNLNYGGHLILYIPPGDFQEFNFKERMEKFLKAHDGFKRYSNDAILILFKQKH